MPFLDHLEELRWRLVKSLGSILLGAAITFFFIDALIDLLINSHGFASVKSPGDVHD